MKIKMVSIFIFLILLGTVLQVSGVIDESIEGKTSVYIQADKWTYMVYFVGDYNKPHPNDVGSMIPAINRMELSGSTSDVNIVIQADDYEVWGGETRRYYIEYDDDLDTINSPLADSDTSEKNMGNPSTLTDFISWAATNYPAQHYALKIFGHGAGWAGVCYDRTSGSPYNDETNIDINELENALSASGIHLDIMFIWACQWGQIEIYYQLKDYVDIIIASESFTSYCNDTCEEPLKQLTSNPLLTPTALSQIIVDNYYFQSLNNTSISDPTPSVEGYTNIAEVLNGDFNYNLQISLGDNQPNIEIDGGEQLSEGYDEYDGLKTMFGIYTGSIDDLTDAVNDFAGSMLDTSNYWGTKQVIKKAFKASEFFDIYDLYVFADYISNSDLETSILNAAQNITSLMDGIDIIAPDEVLDELHGTRIHPPARLDIFTPFILYKNIDFAKDTKWDEFLAKYYEWWYSISSNYNYNILESTYVSMADGSLRNIENVCIGDYIKIYDIYSDEIIVVEIINITTFDRFVDGHCISVYTIEFIFSASEQ